MMERGSLISIVSPEFLDRPDQFEKVKELADRWNLIADPKRGFFDKRYRTKGYIDFVDIIEGELDGGDF